MQAFSDKGKRVTTVLVPSQLQDKNNKGQTPAQKKNEFVMATLTAKNLAKAYKGRRVVEDVSLTVNSGKSSVCWGQTVPVTPPLSTWL